MREKPDKLEVHLSVAAMAAPVANDGFEQPRPLVVAKGVRAQPGGLRCLGDAQFALWSSVTTHAFTIGLRARSRSSGASTGFRGSMRPIRRAHARTRSREVSRAHPTPTPADEFVRAGPGRGHPHKPEIKQAGQTR